ncbi:chromosome segregation ATPase [Streptococcus pyogenes]|nr:Chromosome segregation ATPase [Streptococcus pyogenes]VGT00095.1 Chromosome segregation ATPase [Streptococcus pyogenes]VGT25193.1 Chromosome segregation ATPase [Streptococcus pyogenes]VGT31763.1 Chromosome segregation ATPase [Streptococcus pyogenes]VGT98055.1 Chromosome segregation ATPase [Streptococcus pyogenes]
MKRSTEDILLDLEVKINSKMREFNNILYPDIRKAPQINLNAHNSYSFYTPDDDGTGTKFKGMIVFDLVMLYLTNLPALAHDSLLLSNVSYQATEALLKLYDQSRSLNKQVFLAFDKASSYSPDANQLLSENTVFHGTKEKTQMRFSYNKLWKLLIDKGWTKTKLRQEAGISSSTIAKLGKGENITTDILLKICIALDCKIEDIVEIVDNNI